MNMKNGNLYVVKFYRRLTKIRDRVSHSPACDKRLWYFDERALLYHMSLSSNMYKTER